MIVWHLDLASPFARDGGRCAAETGTEGGGGEREGERGGGDTVGNLLQRIDGRVGLGSDILSLNLTVTVCV